MLIAWAVNLSGLITTAMSLDQAAIPVPPSPLFNLRYDFFTNGSRFSLQIRSYSVYTDSY
jgi:hypothetical protein